MEYLGIKFDLKNVPALDPGFIPFGVWMDAYLKDAKTPIAIAVERQEGQISVRKTFIHGTKEMADADYRCGPLAASRSTFAAAAILQRNCAPLTA